MSFIQPMNSLEMIRQGFAVWKLAPFKLSLINLPAMLTRAILFYLISFFAMMTYAMQSDEAFVSIFLLIFLAVLMVPVLFLLLSANYLPNMAMVTAASNAVLGRPVSIGQAFRRAFSWVIFKKYTLILFFTWMIILFVLMLASMLVSNIYAAQNPGRIDISSFFLPEAPRVILIINFLLVGLITFCLDIAMFLLLPVLVLEKRTWAQTTRRAVTFLREYGSRILLNYLLAYFVPFVLPNLLFGSSYENRVMGDEGILFCIPLLYTIFYLVFSSVGTIVMILSYYNIRARREHYDEQVLAEEMGYRPLGEMIVP